MKLSELTVFPACLANHCASTLTSLTPLEHVLVEELETKRFVAVSEVHQRTALHRF